MPNKTTESDSKYNHLEKMEIHELLSNMNKEDKTVPLAVEKQIPNIERLVAEIVVKAGRQGALVDGAMIAPGQAIEQPTDTSGAGDAFNGGYLAARLRGKSRIEAARAGNTLAGWVVQQRGAIPPVNAALYRPGDEMSEV